MMEESNPTGGPQYSTGGAWVNDNGDYFLKVGLPGQTPDACLNLGSSLVDQYFAQMPVDPKDGSQDKTYYAIAESEAGSVKVVACHAENNEHIEVVR
jgi:hypothetical protein